MSKPIYFDPETLSLLRETLDDAWASLRPQEQATMQKTAGRELLTSDVTVDTSNLDPEKTLSFS